MSLDIQAETPDSSSQSIFSSLATILRLLGIFGITIVMIAAALYVRQEDAPYTSSSGIGYALGVTGGSLMLIMLMYSVRKRIGFMRWLGSLKYWFIFHMTCGIVGPILILFHSRFHVESINALVALSSMLLVAGSGIVGRFIYRRIHHGLYGRRATLEELQNTMKQELAALEPLLDSMPEVKQEVIHFVSLVSKKPAGLWQRTFHFMTLGTRRYFTELRIRRSLAAAIKNTAGNAASATTIKALLKTIHATMKATQTTVQFATYERLFSLWHAVHVPFLILLVLTGIVHVVAVHVYSM